MKLYAISVGPSTYPSEIAQDLTDFSVLAEMLTPLIISSSFVLDINVNHGVKLGSRCLINWTTLTDKRWLNMRNQWANKVQESNVP